MLAEYLAIIAPDKRPDRDFGQALLELATTDLALEPIWSFGRLTLLAAPGAPAYHYDDGRGCLVGVAFDRQTGLRLSNDRGEEEMRSSDNRARLSSIWGAYVSFHVDAAGRAAIMRDPSAGLACYYIEREGYLILSSEARHLQRRLGRELGIDWETVTAELFYPDLRSAQTCLVGISELLPGEQIIAAEGRVERALIWSPHAFASAPSLADDMETAAEHVRETVLGCSRAWAGAFDHILLNLSGGLDSSILATALATGGANMSCLTLVSSSGLGDERSFASLVAEDVGLPLHERFPDAAGTNVKQSAATHLPRPSARSYTQQIGRLTEDLATEIGADALIYGGGGDNVFCYLHSANPAADRLKAEGMGRGFLQTVKDLAGITGCSMWTVARSAWAKRRLSKSWSWPTDTSLLGMEALALPPPPHPWLEGINNLPLGKREHITAIMRAHGVIDYLNQESKRPTLYPLLSQPLLECCLRYPTWLWCTGGINRAIARRAFGDSLPAAIIHRRTKGGFSGLAQRIYIDNRPAIRESILDGQLCKRGIVDRQAVEGVLDGDPQGLTYAHIRILRIADLEAWIAAQERD